MDDSTERWLDQIEESTDYAAWVLRALAHGQAHRRMHFLFHSFESEEQIVLSNDENIDRVAARVLWEHKTTFEELAL